MLSAIIIYLFLFLNVVVHGISIPTDNFSDVNVRDANVDDSQPVEFTDISSELPPFSHAWSFADGDKKNLNKARAITPRNAEPEPQVDVRYNNLYLRRVTCLKSKDGVRPNFALRAANQLSGTNPADKLCTAASGQCSKLACNNHAGIFLCNWRPNTIGSTCRQFGWLAGILVDLMYQDGVYHTGICRWTKAPRYYQVKIEQYDGWDLRVMHC